MASRRFGAESAETRSALLDVAEQIMRDSGYAAVSSRQLAKAAGLSPQIVYYYFKTMDELYAAVFARAAEYYLCRLEEASDSPEPLVALWELSCDSARAVLVQELMALANHRKSIQTLLSDFGRDLHLKQTEIVERAITAKGFNPFGAPAAIVAATLEVAARGFASGGGYDIPAHKQAQTFVLQRLREYGQLAPSGVQTLS